MGVGAFERDPEGFDDGKLVGESVGASDGGKVTGASEGAELFGAAEGEGVEATGVSVGASEKAIDGGVEATVGDFETMVLGLEDG